jgi:CTD small phosphatase-like protein 2
MILVDNAAYSYAYQLDNAVPILPYYKGKNDFELKALQTYIEGMLFAKDMREVNKRTFKLHRYREHDDIDHLVKELYGEYL